MYDIRPILFGEIGKIWDSANGSLPNNQHFNYLTDVGVGLELKDLRFKLARQLGDKGNWRFSSKLFASVYYRLIK